MYPRAILIEGLNKNLYVATDLAVAFGEPRSRYPSKAPLKLEGIKGDIKGALSKTWSKME